MYTGLSLGKLPEQAILHELKVRVPEEILMHDDKDMREGYLVHMLDEWYISPYPAEYKDRPLYLLLMDLCDPFNDIIVVE